MKDTLSSILTSRRCIKLVCGAGNEDAEYVRRLVYLYASCGVQYFDMSANIAVIQAAKDGAKLATKEVFIAISYGISGDPHVDKEEIDIQKCTRCKRCFEVCGADAIYINNQECIIDKSKCIGCGRCIAICPAKAIRKISTPKDISKTLPDIIAEGIDTVELHISGTAETEIFSKWKNIMSMYSGMVSVCLDRSHYGDIQLIALLQNLMHQGPKMGQIIVQADGLPMSGNDDQPSTTLQALAIGQIVDRANLPCYLLLSGGTNGTTTRLAKKFGLSYHGISLGSYARFIVDKELRSNDFWSNTSVQRSAKQKARKLLDYTLSYMGGQT